MNPPITNPAETTTRLRRAPWSRAESHETKTGTAARRGILALAVLCVAGAAWISSLRIPAGPAMGKAFDGPPITNRPSRTTFGVGVFNIHGGRGRDNLHDLSRTAQELRGLDLVGLNEVLGPKLWWQIDQCEELGQRLNMSWLFAPTESRWWDGSFGNGMLSSLPVTAWQRIPFPRAGAHTYRNMVLTTVEVAGKPVHVLLAHLDSRDAQRRQEQLRAAGQLFLSLAAPAVLMGDFNTSQGDPRLDELLATPDVADALADRPAHMPPARIDWILTRGLRTVASGCEDQGASDHPLYWAELEIAE